MKNIAIFKNTDKQEGSQQPDYRLVASWKDGEEWKSVTVGSLWKADGDKGPQLRGQMKDAYTNQEGKEFPAFEIKRVDTKANETVVAAQAMTPEDTPF